MRDVPTRRSSSPPRPASGCSARSSRCPGPSTCPAAAACCWPSTTSATSTSSTAGWPRTPSKRLVRFMSKRELFDHRWSGPLMRSLHHIEVDRGAGVASFETAVDYLRGGRGRRHLPGGDHLPGHGAQGVQDRRGPDRGRGRRPPGAGDPLGHPAADDQGPPARLLRGAPRSASGSVPPLHPTGDGPGGRDRRARTGRCRASSTRRSRPTPTRTCSAAPGGSRPRTGAAHRPSRRRSSWTPTRSGPEPPPAPPSAPPKG